jgi:hypothetical protein
MRVSVHRAKTRSVCLVGARRRPICSRPASCIGTDRWRFVPVQRPHSRPDFDLAFCRARHRSDCNRRCRDHVSDHHRGVAGNLGAVSLLMPQKGAERRQQRSEERPTIRPPRRPRSPSAIRCPYKRVIVGSAFVGGALFFEQVKPPYLTMGVLVNYGKFPVSTRCSSARTNLHLRH